jgi:hypothetical protein
MKQRARLLRRALGMDRFFSPTNLERFRKLASGQIGEVEQHQLLDDLAEEMKVFRREACSVSSSV